MRRERLRERGIRNWQDILQHDEAIPPNWRAAAVQESQRCLAAMQTNDIAYFVEQFAPQDRWRILLHFFDEASYFDIETAGLEYDDPITVIICWHKGQLHTFVEHENLDDFLTLLQDVQLLTSFNGSSFDVPRVLDAFHIPELPCPHLDLRWLCFHRGLRGGLKDITSHLKIHRPSDLADADGELAIRLWARWHHFSDRQARQTLLRYCAADVLLLVALAQELVQRPTFSLHALWQHLPIDDAPLETPNEAAAPNLPPDAFGEASPMRMRGRHRRAS